MAVVEGHMTNGYPSGSVLESQGLTMCQTGKVFRNNVSLKSLWLECHGSGMDCLRVPKSCIKSERTRVGVCLMKLVSIFQI